MCHPPEVSEQFGPENCARECHLCTRVFILSPVCFLGRYLYTVTSAAAQGFQPIVSAIETPPDSTIDIAKQPPGNPMNLSRSRGFLPRLYIYLVYICYGVYAAKIPKPVSLLARIISVVAAQVSVYDLDAYVIERINVPIPIRKFTPVRQGVIGACWITWRTEHQTQDMMWLILDHARGISFPLTASSSGTIHVLYIIPVIALCC